MQVFTCIQFSGLSSLPRAVFSRPRTRVSFPKNLFFCRANFAGSRNGSNDSSISQRVVPANLVAAEKEEAKAVLTLFLKKQGLSSSLASSIIKKSELFIDHLVSRLHSVYTRRELTTLEIRDALMPYLDALHKEKANILADAVKSFTTPPVRENVLEKLPSPPVEERPIVSVSAPDTTFNSNMVEALARVNNVGPAGKLPPMESFTTPPVRENVLEKLPSPPVEERPIVSVSAPNTTFNSNLVEALARVNIGRAGKLPPHVIYLMELGMELELIKQVISKFPDFAYYRLENVRPVVEFLLDLGVKKSDIPVILYKRPQLFGISLSLNLIPTLTFLESFGIDKKQVIYRFPALLTCSMKKLKATVDFLYETGVSSKDVGKILTRYPNIVSYNVEDNLRPTAEYFHSLGVDVAVLLTRFPKVFGLSIKGNVKPVVEYFHSLGFDVAVLLTRCPKVFGLSIKGNLKPVVEFFLEKGYSKRDVATMISKHGAVCSLSLSDNLIPKWEFFLTLDYPKTELVKFPRYFSCSLEGRIKPRHAIVRKSGVKVGLSTLLHTKDVKFEEALKRKITKNAG